MEEEDKTTQPPNLPVENQPEKEEQEEEEQAKSTKRGEGRTSSIIVGGVTLDIDLDKAAEVASEPVVYWNIRRTAEKPCVCCGQLCVGIWILSIVIIGILIATVGSIEFSLGVPFYDRAEINQERQDAIIAGQRDADFVATYGQEEGDICVHEDPTELKRDGTLVIGPAPSASCQRAGTNRLRILYISSDRESNIFTKSNLEKIGDIQATILNEKELTRYCNLLDSAYGILPDDPNEWAPILAESAGEPQDYTSCKRITSPLNFLDPRYFDYEGGSGLGYYLINEDVISPQYNLTDENVASVLEFWSQFQSPTTFDLTGFDAAVQTIGETISIPNIFYQIASSDFVSGSDGTIGLMMTYELGLPINGFESSSEEAADQHEETGQWLWDTYDSFLKGASFDGVDVYFADTEGGMSAAEQGYSATQSFLLFPFSVLFVLVYLIYMQDSIFVGCVGIMQILLSFVPGLILYRYIFGTEYLGVLNLISIYIILGIGVDDIFVFCDQWNHNAGTKRLDLRLQQTWSTAAKNLFTTSCTTFVSFMSNAASAFPAVATFGLFSALMIIVKYVAIITFFPAAYTMYWTHIRDQYWFDHPSKLCCFCCGKKDKKETTNEDDEGAEGEIEAKSTGGEVEHIEEESKLVTFFRETWAPYMVRFRYIVIVIFAAIMIGAIILALGLEPDEESPNTLQDDNNYVQEQKVLLKYFARAENPRNIEVHWISGIDPDDPIDRSGTDDTNTTDYGTTNFVDCSSYDPTTSEAQVYSLNTCHDMYFGNVTGFHGNSDSLEDEFGVDGKYGPVARRMVTDGAPMSDYNYYQYVTCFAQGLRDWLLTDVGCEALQNFSLPCADETMQRDGCRYWDTNGNSCEPFPLPREVFLPLTREFLLDETADPTTGETNYDQYSDLVLASTDIELDQTSSIQNDFSCRTRDGVTLYAIDNTATLQQDFAINYEEGLKLYGLWDTWSTQVRQSLPLEMRATMQSTLLAWAYYFLNDTLLEETFSSIALALGLSFVILALVQGNPYMALLSVFTILLIVIDVFAFTVMMGWKLGVLEAVNYVVVIGMSIDYCVHMSEAYESAKADTRGERVTLMLEEMAVSVLSGALSTLGACFFMFFAPNKFFVKFATFMFVTMSLSCIYALTFFPALLATVGPMGEFGDLYTWIGKHWKELKHNHVIKYIHTEEFLERENMAAARSSMIAEQGEKEQDQ